jgi:hypothetical protein
MKSRHLLGVVIAVMLLAASTGVHAQLGGLLKKKAGEIIKGKPAPTAPAPAAPAPAETPATAETPTTEPTPAASGSGTTAAPPAATSADPLDPSNLSLPSNVNRFVQEDPPVPEGEWSQMPFFGTATRAALRLLDDPGRVAFIEKTGPAIRALVESEAFGKAHADHIKQQFDAVDHGLKGVMGVEDFVKKQDFKGMEAFTKRQTVMNVVDNVERQSAADIQRTLGYELESWRRSATTATGKNQAKYQTYVKDGEALVALGTGDVVKLRRGYARLKSIDMDGPDTEEAVYAMHAKAKQEAQQIAWDDHNLRGVLKQQLSAFVALAATVDFDAQTVAKDGELKFVKAAYERKGAIWKACFRAGEPATTAAVRFAQAWLKDLP